MRLLLTTILTILTCSSAAYAEKIILVADEWCPYNCTPDDPMPGILVEIAKSAFEPKGIEVEYNIMPWARAVEDVRRGTYHALLGAAYGDAEEFIFPKTPQAMMRNSFYVRRGNPWRFRGMDSLSDISIGVIAAYSYSQELDTYIADHKSNMTRIQILSGDDAAERNLKKLQAGRVGALVEASYVMDYRLNRDELHETIVAAGQLPPSDQDKLFIAFSPNHINSSRYVAILNEAMVRMQKSGELKTITDRYIRKKVGHHESF